MLPVVDGHADIFSKCIEDGLDYLADATSFQASIANLKELADKSGLTPEQLDQLSYAARNYLEREQAGIESAVSDDGKGPEGGYAPSESLKKLLPP